MLQKLSPAEVAKRIEKVSGRKPHISTIIRWITRGAGGRKLPAIRQGCYWFVDPADADAFIQIVNANPGSAVARNADAAVSAQLESIIGTRRTPPAGDVVEVNVSADKPVSVKRKGAK